MAEHRGLPGSVLGSLRWKGRAHWVLTLYPDAREASGVWLAPGRQEPVEGRNAGGTADPERSRSEAGRRAKMTMRLYCVSNKLNRLGTLTYAGEGLHDPEELRVHVAEFFKRLRAGITVKRLPARVKTGDAFPYVWVPQWHPGGHGLHAHFAVGRYIPRGAIEAAWPHGFIHIKQLSNLSTAASGPLGEARLAARYLSRYIGSQLDDERRRLGLHRYEVAQGFQPVEVKLHGRSADEVIEQASRQLGAEPSRVWRSDQAKEGWYGPPACWAQWPPR